MLPRRADGNFDATWIASFKSLALMKETAELFLGLGKRPVGDGHLAIPDPHGRGHLDRFKSFRRDERAGLGEGLTVGHGFVHDDLNLALGHVGELLFLMATHEQVFHGSKPPVWVRCVIVIR